MSASLLEDNIGDLKGHRRKRRFAIKAQQKLDRQLESYVRSTCTDWHMDATDAVKKKANAAVVKIIKEAKAGKGDPAVIELVVSIEIARKPFDTIRTGCDKNIAKTAATLPVWGAFGANIRGFGVASLGAIIGEAGDLANYPKKGHLWKRMGVAVIDGKRQGNAGKGASAEEWITHGYNPERRSTMWNIEECLLKQNKGEYRQAYDQRKAYEIARDPEIRPIVAHARAKRYMGKKLLKDLWQAWKRDTTNGEEGRLPAANKAADLMPSSP